MAWKGQFKPKNPQKYRGDPTNIWYRSSWELQSMIRLDGNPEVVQWSSEEIQIPYVSPKDGRVHRYFPDFHIKMQDGSQSIVEIKPMKETVPPSPKGKSKRKFLSEVMTYGVNDAKFRAARAYCKQRAWHFQVITEHELGVTF